MGRPWGLGLGGGVGEDLDSGFSVNLASTLITGDAHRGVASSVRGLPVGPGLAPHSRDPVWPIAAPRKRCCGATERLTGRVGWGRSTGLTRPAWSWALSSSHLKPDVGSPRLRFLFNKIGSWTSSQVQF